MNKGKDSAIWLENRKYTKWERKKAYLGKCWFINLTSEVRRVLEQVLKEQINKDTEVKDVFATVQ